MRMILIFLLVERIRLVGWDGFELDGLNWDWSVRDVETEGCGEVDA